MTRPRLVTIGWTRSDRDNDYSSFSDGYRPGASQHTETLEINTDWGAELIASAAFHATNAPEELIDPNSVAGLIAKVLENRGFDGTQSGHYSLSVGDTVTVDGVMLACERLGWTIVNYGEVQQARIRKAAEDLLALLDTSVPASTVHYAVEDARRALRELARQADTIKTGGAA